MKFIAGKNLVLIGFMGTGKTEVGTILANKLIRKMLDTDQLIAEREGMSVAEIFICRGEAYFRERESELAEELSLQKELVVSTGGGIVLNSRNIELLRINGFIVWLDAECSDLIQRLAGDKTRPLLSKDDKEKEIVKLYKEREHLYRQACDLHVDTTGRTPLTVSDDILKMLH